MRLKILSAALFLCLCSFSKAWADATLLLEEPYSYDGALAGTGHASVYLSGVCASSPVVLRLCEPGETGVVLSRYHGVTRYDWVAIPLIPYLYAVEKQEDIPLYADARLVSFLRDRYRRDHLESIVPDEPDGKAPSGDWYEFLGEAYLRTIYAYEIETTPEQDAALIRRLNGRPNRESYKLVTANCADFARQIINFYYPHAVHRSIVGDLGVTTPKQLALTLARYSRHHSELQTSHFLIPQVPGALPRSKPVHGVLECAVTAKKYMLPVLVLHPYIAGSLIAGYIGHGRFDPSTDALVLDAGNRLGQPMTHADRRADQDRLDELVKAPAPQEAAGNRPDLLHTAAEPSFDVDGEPLLEVRNGGTVTPVGIARDNILNEPDGFEFAAGLVKARLREELKPAAARKTARSDVENDLALLQRLLQPQSRESAAGFSSNPGSLRSTLPATP